MLFCKNVVPSLWDLDLSCFLNWKIFILFKFEVYLVSISYIQGTELGALGEECLNHKLLPRPWEAEEVKDAANYMSTGWPPSPGTQANT